MAKDYIVGYKAFENTLINRYGVEFKVGDFVSTDGPIKPGLVGNGFHLCEHFEDCFRFVDTNQNILLCKVIGFGEISDEYEDDYNGYYGIYACSHMYIEKIMQRDEIIEMGLELSKDNRLTRFIEMFPMSDDEILKFEERLSEYDKHLKKTIDYYHYGNKKAFE